VGDRDPRIDEQVISVAFAFETGFDFRSPLGERRAAEKLLENSGEGSAGVQQNPLWPQELVNH
jgi:hypothetical protein